MTGILDIETIGNPKAIARAIVALPVSTDIKPPGNYRDEEKIWKYQTSKLAAMKKAIKDEAALSWHTGMVACICSVHEEDEGTFMSASNNEEELLLDLADEMGNWTRIVTFNGRSFDLPMLVNRMLVNQVKIPEVLRSESRYAMKKQVDLYEVLTSFGANPRGTLRACAETLGVLPEGDEGHTPQDVLNMYQAGQWDKLIDLCMGDVMITKAIYLRARTCGLIPSQFTQRRY